MGGGAKLKHIADYAKETLGLAARLGTPTGFGGVAEDVDKSEYATAIGLMLIDAEQGGSGAPKGGGKLKAPSAKDAKGALSKLFARFRA